MKKLFRNWNFELLFQMFLPLLGGFLISLLVRSMGSLTTSSTYLNIPPLIFSIVWAILYLLMGYSAYRIEFESGEKNIHLYYVSLIFNFLWLPLFFLLNSPIIALIDLLILLFLIVFNFKKYYKIDRTSAYLLLPYIIWLLFAVTLNISAI